MYSDFDIDFFFGIRGNENQGIEGISNGMSPEIFMYQEKKAKK